MTAHQCTSDSGVWVGFGVCSLIPTLFVDRLFPNSNPQCSARNGTAILLCEGPHSYVCVV